MKLVLVRYPKPDQKADIFRDANDVLCSAVGDYRRRTPTKKEINRNVRLAPRVRKGPSKLQSKEPVE